VAGATRPVRLNDAVRDQVERLLQEGRTRDYIARTFGISTTTVGAIKRERGAIEPAYVRNVHESMDAPEWRDKCMHARATAHACTDDATWYDGEWQVCDEHRPKRRRRLRMKP